MDMFDPEVRTPEEGVELPPMPGSTEDAHLSLSAKEIQKRHVSLAHPSAPKMKELLRAAGARACRAM